mmetsp:Transcript_16710/g.38409  ORF Transcript_16710/g.38409 Transcript_16710/m.38409 type:complete len:106 (+) Transcript_16710:440-757(+)
MTDLFSFIHVFQHRGKAYSTGPTELNVMNIDFISLREWQLVGLFGDARLKGGGPVCNALKDTIFAGKRDAENRKSSKKKRKTCSYQELLTEIPTDDNNTNSPSCS